MEFEQLFSLPTFNLLSSYYELSAVFLRCGPFPQLYSSPVQLLGLCDQTRCGLAPMQQTRILRPSLAAKQEASPRRPFPQLSSNETQRTQGPRKQVGKSLKVRLLGDKHVLKGPEGGFPGGWPRALHTRRSGTGSLSGQGVRPPFREA